MIVTVGLFACGLRAQALPVGTAILPANPTSADNLKLSMPDRTCGGFSPYVGNAYRVAMLQNVLTVTLGERVQNPVPVCPNAPREEVDLGRLPAGTYGLTLISAATPSAPTTVFSNVGFTVADARLIKAAPYVRLDYSGHWWDPNDSGWGLFIWHDARDNVLAAWFTYGTDGKAIWYVFQPTWQTSTASADAPLFHTSRAPGPTSPPPNPTSISIAGTASLDFTNFGTGETGTLSYTFNGGTKLVRNIQRFKP